ncbi:flagellar hook-length control protein FliK [Vibrio navarrensis]|uniref:Flagellar hook-length control protein FliK n=1 Tax=Vibrio navarrensis TaxID=29495 RepID=A0AAI9CSG2_9VIBR|nr:flagellar hook-length control protein FliK [Vibrio navarrensis]EJL6394083.1 flagellar hook-length control protein FliK [Vibrio navarrensis]EKA5634844.1 flagellar hook-length control protein FliK [Vibrio navarrensis]ELN6931743.1 flagellar hook-length control protein FliK [Vibrio navarrensis]
MNVNLQLVSITGKTAGTTAEASSKEVTGEVAESGGFLQTLAKVFSGQTDDKKADKTDSSVKDGAPLKAENLTAESETTQNSEGEAVDGAALEGSESSDELLQVGKTQTEGSAQSEVQVSSAGQSETVASTSSANAQTTNDAAADVGVTKSNSSTKAGSEKQAVQESVMHEGSKILGQLEQANATLQPKNGGKALPTKAVAEAVSPDNSADGLPSLQLEKGDAMALNANAFTAEQAASLPSSAQVGVSRQSAESLPPSAASSLQSTSDPLAQLQPQALSASRVDAGALPPETLAADPARAAQMTNGQIEWHATAGLQMQAQDESPLHLQQQVSSEQPVMLIPAPRLAEIEQKLATEQALNGEDQQILQGLLDGQLQAEDPAVLAALPALSTVLVAASNAELNTLRSDGVANAPRAAIDWNQAAPIDNAHTAKESGAKLAATTTALSQAVHSALQNSQPAQALVTAQPTSDKAPTAGLPDGLAPNAMAALQSTAQPNVTPTKGLQAALAASGLTALKGKSANEPSSERATNTTQSSLYSAQGSPTTNGQVRAEAASQVPMQLTREMASEQVAEKVQMMMSKNLKNLDIRLDPPELGRMQIRMTMNNDLAHVHFTVSNPQAREMIEQTLPRLREMLAQQGMQLADSSVQQQASGQQQRQYSAGGQGDGQQTGRFASGNDENLEPEMKLDVNVASKRDGISFYA